MNGSCWNFADPSTPGPMLQRGNPTDCTSHVQHSQERPRRNSIAILLKYHIHIDKLLLADILENHQRIADKIISTLAGAGHKILALFKAYLAVGYYPYFQEYQDSKQFYLTIEQNIHTTLESDLPAIYQTLNGASVRKIERLLAIISSLVPYVPDMKQLKNMLEIGEERTLKSKYPPAKPVALNM
jgi:hypothetical protein